MPAIVRYGLVALTPLLLTLVMVVITSSSPVTSLLGGLGVLVTLLFGGAVARHTKRLVYMRATRRLRRARVRFLKGG